MNRHLQTRPAQHAAAFALALFVTTALLGGVDHLATASAHHAYDAHVAEMAASPTAADGSPVVVIESRRDA